MERWVALDVETTGLSPTRNDIRELAAVPFGIHNQAECVMSFSAGETQPSARSAARARWAGLLQVIGGDCVIVAHNAAFDLAFLAEALRRSGAGPFVLRAYCTLRLARCLIPGLPRYDLEYLTQALKLGTGRLHAALADARAVAALFVYLMERAGCRHEEEVQALHGPPLQVRFRSSSRSAFA